MQNMPPCYIVSATTPGMIPGEIALRTQALNQELLHYGPTKSLMGSYKGVQEHSLLVIPEDLADFALNLPDILTRYKQECALLLSADRFAFYVSVKDGALVPERAGKWKHVSKQVAHKSESYTYDPIRDQYFVADPCECLYPTECPHYPNCSERN